MKLKINILLLILLLIFDITNFTIDSKKHHLETKEQYKIAIDPFDDKGIKSCNGEFRFHN